MKKKIDMMWRLTLLVIAFVGATASINESSVHKVFRITPKNEEQLEFLRNFNDSEDSGWTFWRGPSIVSKPVDLMVSPSEKSNFISLMESHGIAYKILIDNVERLLVESNRKTHNNQFRSRSHRKKSFDWTRYYNLTEINNWLDTLVKEFPAYVEPIIGGRSEQGRKIRGVKLSFGGDVAMKPGIFIEGGSHAREWISPATVTYILNQLLHSNDPKVRDLAEAHDWFIFPVFNPDGYAYTHQNPKNMSNRFWRKTRSTNNSNNCHGTDMNRNWAHKWNVVGASKDPCSRTYGGSAPFSAIETKTLSQYISSISDKLFAYLSFHSFSQYLMFPYGHTDMHMDNYDDELAIAKSAVKALSRRYGTEYQTGSIAELVGLASGSSVDWVKATFKLPLVFGYEVRDKGNKGFLLPPDQIIPNGQEILDSLVALFQEAQTFGYPRQS